MTETMTFKEARDFVMPLGKHKGLTIGEIGDDDEGLRYLDWLVGQDWINGRLKEALNVYLGDPSIAREVERLMG